MQAETTAKSLPSVMALSYLGDARHALYVRKMLVGRGISRSKELNAMALEYVTAEAQARLFLRIEGELSEEEKAVFKRAFNSGHLNKPKHASGKEYRTATGFEAAIGMLECQENFERLEYLLDLMHDRGEED